MFRQQNYDSGAATRGDCRCRATTMNRNYVLFSRSLRDGAGSFDDDRQTNALFGCKEYVRWLWGKAKVLVNPMRALCFRVQSHCNIKMRGGVGRKKKIRRAVAWRKISPATKATLLVEFRRKLRAQTSS